MKNKDKDYIALLTITEFPKTKKTHDRLRKWLEDMIKNLDTTDPSNYASPCRFRLMK